eukprot:6301100-Pyramimonas_sp.AAC.1
MRGQIERQFFSLGALTPPIPPDPGGTPGGGTMPAVAASLMTAAECIAVDGGYVEGSDEDLEMDEECGQQIQALLGPQGQ